MALAYKNIYLILSALLLFSSISFAIWSESVVINAVDTGGRPLSNASVTIVYQSYTCDKHELLTLTTNSSGSVLASFANYVTEEGVYPPCVERQYTIRAYYMGTTAETIGSVGKQPAYNVILPLAAYFVNVKGINGKSLYPINYSYGAIKFTSQTNVAVFELPLNQEFEFNISYGEISNISRVNLHGDIYGTIILPVYDVHIRLFNESGDRIKGQIKVGDLSQWSLPSEDAVFENFPYLNSNFTIIVDNIERHVEKKIDSANLTVYLDLTPPVIKDVSQTVVKGNVILSASVSDEGNYASKLLSNPIVQYLINDSTNWTVIKMFPKSAKIFEAEIPSSGQNVVYQIIAYDKQGNQEVYDGRYEFKPTIKPPGPGKIPSLQEILTGLIPNISLPNIIGIAIFILVIFLVYRRIKEVV